MGQSPSSLGSRSGRTRRSLRSFTRRCKLNKSSLSHTFSMPPSDEYPELMNVNTATEEQLMTLPGINRQLARNIVLHRQMIGRFKRVDDLALVSGIGAEKLAILRPEICTNARKGLSRTSSCAQSLDSMRLSSDSRLCSVNSASVFQLQCVQGLNQEIAANIVDYRNKKGPFKSLDDLIKVRGMDIIRLSTVKPHLSLEARKYESAHLLNGHMMNGWSTDQSLNDSFLHSTPQPRSPHRKSLSMPTKFPITFPNGFATAPVNDILDLLAAYSHRPIVEEDFRYERGGVKCCRLASWNLHQLSVDKINNPGVREVVCRTILENKLSLLAVQDVVDEVALKIICDELNSPVLRRVREWKNNSHRWEFCVSENSDSKNLGFIYDSANKNICIQCIGLEEIIMEDTKAKIQLLDELAKLQHGARSFSFHSEAFLICDKPLLLVNLFCEKKMLKEVSQLNLLFRLAEKVGMHLAVMGDFNNLDNVLSLSNTSHSLLDEAVHTSMDANVIGRSGILCHSDMERSGFNGTWGAVRTGLSHLAIPSGWSWGGPASPHCPVWAEFNLSD